MMSFGQVLKERWTRQAGPSAAPIEADIIARLSAMPEPHVLDYFWLMSREAARLPLLLQLTHVVIARPEDWDFAVIRREHEQGVGKNGIRLERRRCFACCDESRRLYFHHVIEIQNGGSNAVRNKLPLCFPCHQYLHPWLTQEPPRTGAHVLFDYIAEHAGP